MTSPFDEAKYRALLEGLEVAEIHLSELERTMRIDAEFFGKSFLDAAGCLKQRKTEALTKVAGISDGNHFSISDEFQEEGIPYYRGQDATGHFFIEQAQPVYIPHKAFAMPHMRRSHLRKGDALLSIVGTIGELSLVSSESEATCNCKLAILRPQTIKSGYLAVFLKSRYGQDQIHRLTRGAVQMGLLLEDMDQINIPRFSDRFEEAIEKSVHVAKIILDNSIRYYQQAEQTILRAIGLEDWQPPEVLTYERKAADVFAAGRLDAEHFQEQYFTARRALRDSGAISFIPLDEILTALTNGHTPLHHDLSVGEVPFLCAEHINNFEISYESEKRILEKHHKMELSRTALKEGDVLMTIKGKVGNMALVEDLSGPVNINQDVALLRFKETLPLWYVVAFVNSRFGNMFSEQLSTGGINPFLGLGNVRLLEIPRFDDDIMLTIANETKGYAHKARHARKQARILLDQAKHAVEIAIEKNEEAAMAFLKQSQEASL